MGISSKDIQTALKIRRAVIEYFDRTGESKVMAKDLMPIFISKEIFTKDHKDGYPIRHFLRQLEENGLLRLIPQCAFEQKDVNKTWYFINVK